MHVYMHVISTNKANLGYPRNVWNVVRKKNFNFLISKRIPKNNCHRAITWPSTISNTDFWNLINEKTIHRKCEVYRLCFQKEAWWYYKKGTWVKFPELKKTSSIKTQLEMQNLPRVQTYSASLGWIHVLFVISLSLISVNTRTSEFLDYQSPYLIDIKQILLFPTT